MHIDLTGKKAIVGGACKGLGRATAMELAALGASVTLVARGEAGLKDVLGALPNKAGQAHHYFAADTSDIAALQDKAADHVAKHGPFHILINNSGGPPAGPAHLAALDDFQKAFNQHLLANHVMMQAVLPGMKAEGYGRIVNIMSTSVKQPIKGLGVSNTVRGAVANWAKTLSSELAGFGVTVNNVLPGATDTDRMAEIISGKAAKFGRAEQDVIADEIAHIPAGRFGTPEELAQAIAFLASPAAAYINGINLPVDGGRTGCL
jgi:3-oxoacyl-[acyl-carrier protein] reductase